MTRNQFWAVAEKIVTVLAVTFIVVWAFAPTASAATKYKALYQFTGGADGDQAWSSVVFDEAGDLYGTTEWGGAYGWGTVFKLTHNLDGSWTETVIHNFTGGADGAYPDHQVLVFDATGNIYGTAGLGGDLNKQCYPSNWGPGCGVVFKLTPNPDGTWTQSVLYTFTGGKDGGVPAAPLTFDAAGNLYGKTAIGGGKGCPDYHGCGVIFKLSPNPDGSWTQSVIHSFRGGRDGNFPDEGELIFDGDGNLYGTTNLGGGKGCPQQQGCGVVFELMPNADGTYKEKVLHRFGEGKEGGWIDGNLVFDADGNLYGTTMFFGAYGVGTVYRLSPKPDGSWSYKVIHQFKGGKDGAESYAGLVIDAAGNLYGTTRHGGLYGYGTVFKLTPKPDGGWTERILHAFAARPAAYACERLTLDAAGNVFGTTTHNDNDGGGNAGASVVFEITP